MRIRNKTGLLFGAKVTSRRPPRPELTAIVRGTFALHNGGIATPLEGIPQIAQGPLQAEVFRPGDDERLGDCLYPGDFADFKPRADVLLVGTCHAPDNRLIRECNVRFGVGTWSKTLRVTGRRVWTERLLGPAMSEPQPFVKMPIDWPSSFGGPTFARNPAGKGAGPGELPTLEDPAHLLRSQKDQPEPAGFGPINPAWPQRAAKQGKAYGPLYSKTRAPFYAEDFDWSHFNAAPADQQLPTYLRGDEELTFENLHPDHPVYTCRLPGVRARVLVTDREGRAREVPMVLDTLFVNLDEERVVLTWRGLTEIREVDRSDVTFALVASERLTEPPLAEEAYRAQLAAFEADPIGLNDLPAPMTEAAGARSAEPAASPPADALEGLLDEKLAPLAPKDRAMVRQRIDEAIAKAPPGTDLRAKILEALSGAGAAEAAPMVMPRAPGGKPRASLRAPLRSLLEAAAKARALAEQGKASPEDLRVLAQAEALRNDPRLLELDPTLREPTSEEPGPGRDLSGQDLSGRDLRGADLRGARLDGAILTGANLSGARLGGASLEGAVLFKTDLRRADLAGANLSLCNAASALLEGASLEGANLEQAYFKEAVLRGADLRRTFGQFVSFTAADLASANLGAARFSQSDFEGASLEGADLAEAEFVRTAFRKCRASGASFRGARLGNTSFMDAVLDAAIFTGAWAEGSIWIRAHLRGADLRLSHLARAHFTEAVADQARFFGADLRDARLYRASLVGAGFGRANLFGADLCKANLDRARFPGASLYDAKLIGASVTDCDFRGANLERARFDYT